MDESQFCLFSIQCKHVVHTVLLSNVKLQPFFPLTDEFSDRSLKENLIFLKTEVFKGNIGGSAFKGTGLHIKFSYSLGIQLFQKTLSKEKQKAHKPRLQGNMGIFETS